MKLNRAMQRRILEELRDAYPDGIDFQSRTDFIDQDFQGNLFYLREHGLIDGPGGEDLDGPPTIAWASITAPGLDFLEADGGLSAILKTVIVRLDGESILPILEKIVAASNLPPEEKKSMAQKLRGLPGKILETLILKSIEAGIEHPDKIATLIGHAVYQIQT
jgi:hypothetical protein